MDLHRLEIVPHCGWHAPFIYERFPAGKKGVEDIFLELGKDTVRYTVRTGGA